MSSTPAAALVVLLTLALVIGTSGVAKLRDRRSTRDAFDALRVPSLLPADTAARALPWVEVALAALLLVAPAGWLVPVAAAVLAIMLTYTWLVARALGFDEPVSCSCFGNLGRHHLDRTTLARNVLLTVLAVSVLWFALDDGSAPAIIVDLDTGGWAVLAAAAAAAIVAVLVVGGGEQDTSLPVLDDELMDYERQPIPYGVLGLPDGKTATLTELASSQARLVVVLNAHCGPCIRTAEKLDTWTERLQPAVGLLAVYPEEQSAVAATGHSPELRAWEPELNVRRLFHVVAPAAVLLGVDGMLAGGPVTGEDAVADFVADVLSELTTLPLEESAP